MGKLQITPATITRVIKAIKAAGEQVTFVQTAADGGVLIYLAGKEVDDCDQSLANWVKKNANKS